MNVSLTPELEEMINKKVKSGMYSSASEVVRESLRRMFKEENSQQSITNEQRQQMNDLREEVLKGVKQIRDGDAIRYDSPEDLTEDIIKRESQNLAEKQRIKASL